MAGIGFTLRKIMGRSYMSFILQAAFTGVFIVAGPWLLSILNLSLLGALLPADSGVNPSTLFAPIVYGYAFFLITSSPLHYLFTRMAADFLYNKQERQVTRIMLWFLVPIELVGLVVSLGILYFADPTGTVLSLPFRLGYVLFGLGINALWLILIVVSLLRWHGRLLASFLFSMGISVAVLLVIGNDLPTIMLAFGASNVLLAVVLGILCLGAFAPARIAHLGTQVRTTLYESRFLIASGWLYGLTLWSEKILYWFTKGSRVGDLGLRLFETYDFAVYIANLSLIPGMVYFVIYAETSFASNLRRFLNALDHQTYAFIQREKVDLLDTVKVQIRLVALVQGAVMLVLALLTPFLSTALLNLNPQAWLMNLGIVLFQSLNVTLMNFLYYINQFRRVFRVTLTYLFMVLSLSLIEIALGLPLGLGALLGAFGAFWLYAYQLKVAIASLDRIILTRKE